MSHFLIPFLSHAHLPEKSPSFKRLFQMIDPPTIGSFNIGCEKYRGYYWKNHITYYHEVMIPLPGKEKAALVFLRAHLPEGTPINLCKI